MSSGGIGSASSSPADQHGGGVIAYGRHGGGIGDPPRRPNVAWFVSRDLRHGPQLSWRLVADVEAGEELLAEYG